MNFGVGRTRCAGWYLTDAWSAIRGAVQTRPTQDATPAFRTGSQSFTVSFADLRQRYPW